MALASLCPSNLSHSIFIPNSSSSSSCCWVPHLPISIIKRYAASTPNFFAINCCTTPCLPIHVQHPPQKRRKKTEPTRAPGFYDETRERWSVKIASQRVKYPWQQQEEEEAAKKEEEHESSLFQPPPSHSTSLEETSTTWFNKSLSVLHEPPLIWAPPWSHGPKPPKTLSPEETSRVQGCCETTAAQKSSTSTSTVGLIVEKLKQFNHANDSAQQVLNAAADEPPGFVVDNKSGGSGTLIKSLPWERGSNRRSKTTSAESTVPEPELRRLRSLALRMKERTKVGVAGITQALVDAINLQWKDSELVKIQFQGPPAFDMKRTHSILERKTGGVVIWRSGSSVVLYRGMTYKLPCARSYMNHTQTDHGILSGSMNPTADLAGNIKMNASVRATEAFYSVSVTTAFVDKFKDISNKSNINDLLDDLGPRFKDWSGCDPLPVDADLLSCVIPGYKPPFRLLPYETRHCIGNKQMTAIRRLARKMPPHFALGRNRQHHGLAKAMVKLWEVSAIAKIAIKRGVQNTCNERMAEEIKKLTGGTLMSRNKDYIVFYRGNDFLPPVVTEALLEREKLAKLKQDEEEAARVRASTLIVSNVKRAGGPPRIAGTLAETTEASFRWGNPPSSEDREEMMRATALARHAALVRHLERKLALANGKVRKAEKALAKAQEFLKPAELPTDLEIITDEERFTFRKMGLSMKPFLLLGRRGVFDGTVENMHLHWKYRELVKIIVKAKKFALVKHIAISLEAESGGVLISVDKTSKGYAIIIYRGKNYFRPSTLRPKNLLTRKKALARSIELQRREALKHHISDLKERIEMLRLELDRMENTTKSWDEDLYMRSAITFPSDDDDDDMEDEGEEAYLGTYCSGSDDDDDDDDDGGGGGGGSGGGAV